ncbi:MAG: O-methyltransferase [Myxococcota bacterium]|nr:O-methyltransferase [Myxococcota bacterium]
MKIVDETIEEYALAHSTPEHALFGELRDETFASMECPQMIAGRFVGSFLQMMIRSSQAKRIVEVGTFTGYSTLKMAEALPDDGEIHTFEYEPTHAAMARRYFARSPWGHKITLHEGAALETLPSIEGPIDLSFIDADKVNYVSYYHHLVELTRPGGLVVLDNALWSGRVLNPEEPSDHALAEMNRVVRDDPKVHNLLMPMRDGLMVAQKLN